LAEGLCGDPFVIAKPFFLEGHWAYTSPLKD
jgi:hypothetical protein